MNQPRRLPLSIWGPTVTLALLLCLLSSGCGLAVNLINAGWGNMVDAEFEGLVGKRVAVVCVSNTSSFGPRPISREIATRVSDLLAANVDEIQMVDQDEIDRWIDEHEWNQVDYLELGRGVKAEMLVAIDLLKFKIHEGQTMFKGRTEMAVTVYDLLNDDQEVFSSEPPEFRYPVNAALHVGEISERDFRRQFINMVASRIARMFYPYEFKEDFARDPTMIGS